MRNRLLLMIDAVFVLSVTAGAQSLPVSVDGY